MSVYLYTAFGQSGLGKSVLTLEDALYVAQQGANVLIYAEEMGWFEVMVRIYTSLSGEQGITRATFDGVDMDAGFNARDIRIGALSDEFEAAFREFVRNINDYVSGNIIVRAVDDEDAQRKSLRTLEADIKRHDIDFVMIDPFYYLEYRSEERRVGKECR